MFSKKNSKLICCLLGLSLYLSTSTLALNSYNIPLQGKASWIGERFQGKKTASGELFDMNDLTASHATLPFGTLVKVTSEKSKKSVTVRVNNRSEIDSGRIIDLSRRAAEQINLIEEGVGLVKIEIVSSPSTQITNNAASQTNNVKLSSNINTNTSSGKFLIQYGSFFDLDNASDLKEALRKKGIDSNIETVKGNNKTIYRVYSVQKYINRETAKEVLDALAPQEGLIISDKTIATEISSNSSKQKTQNDKHEYGVQFGAFSSLEYAKEMQNRLLIDKSIRSLIHQFPDDDKKLYRVLSNSPFSSHDEADKFIKSNSVNGTILKFLK